MKISVFGLGYVGAVTTVCLASQGHDVIGVDSNNEKVDLINEGKSPIYEPGVAELMSDLVGKKKLRATADYKEAVQSSEITIVCVGTPSRENGDLGLEHVRAVAGEIGASIANKAEYHVVVLRSTMLPGSSRSEVIPILEQSSGKHAGTDFGVVFNPEFLREGTAIKDFYDPPKTVVGEFVDGDGDLLVQIYDELNVPSIRATLEVAEAVKYADNSWHALKVCFANEIGQFCKASGVDSHAVMDIFCKDTKLNLSPYYLKPGFAFGGSCLPKDLRALNYRSKSLDLQLPVLSSILSSNEHHLTRALDLVLAQKKKKIGILGLSFKANTDDLRESPMVELAERLLGKGFELSIYDSSINVASLVGANREFVFTSLPHLSNLLSQTLEEVVGNSDLLVIGNNTQEFLSITDYDLSGKTVLDFVRLFEPSSGVRNYEGLCW